MVRDVEAGYGAVRVLHGVSLEVREGETVALLGTNGNGKSTLIKCIMGMIAPAGGEIFLEREGRRVDLTRKSTEEIVSLGIALVPEGRRLFPKLSVEEHLRRGYDLVYTPHVGRIQLWETSGHLGWYKENMFAAMEMEGQDYMAKPMNCPFHIQVYQSKLRSYRELPVRLFELGTVYRYERGGVLHGLLRVSRRDSWRGRGVLREGWERDKQNQGERECQAGA